MKLEFPSDWAPTREGRVGTSPEKSLFHRILALKLAAVCRGLVLVDFGVADATREVMFVLRREALAFFPRQLLPREATIDEEGSKPTVLENCGVGRKGVP
jgi:hypothetical protein